MMIVMMMVIVVLLWWWMMMMMGAARASSARPKLRLVVMDGTALRAVSEASVSGSEDELRLLSWIL